MNRFSVSIKEDNQLINYVDISSVGIGRINEFTTYQIEDAPGRAKRLAKNGDSIFSTVRPENRCYALVLNQTSRLVFSTGFAVFTPKHPLYSLLIYSLISSDSFIMDVSNKAKGAAYPQVSFDDLMTCKIILPDRESLMKFDKLGGAMYQKIANLQSQLTTLRQTRDALLPRLLSGQLSVGEGETAGSANGQDVTGITNAEWAF